MVGKGFISGVCLPQCIPQVLLGVGYFSRLLWTQCIKPCPAFLNRVSAELLSTPLFPWRCSLSRYCSHAATPELSQASLEPGSYTLLKELKDDLLIISQGPTTFPFHVFNMFPVLPTLKPGLCDPLGCPFLMSLAGQVAAAPWRPPVETSLCPWTTKLLTLSWKLLPALS